MNIYIENKNPHHAKHGEDFLVAGEGLAACIGFALPAACSGQALAALAKNAPPERFLHAHALSVFKPLPSK